MSQITLQTNERPLSSRIQDDDVEKDLPYSKEFLKPLPFLSKDIATSNNYQERSKNQLMVWNVLRTGNILPEGPLEDTPPGMKVNLKQHQKRMLYEMLVKENLDYRVSSGINAFCIGDKVGAGKSIEILSLISRSPYVDRVGSNQIIYKAMRYRKLTGLVLNPTQEFRSNLIVVPHGIFNQWITYITKCTSLKYIGIATRKDIAGMDLKALTTDTAPHIVLVKSTRYNELCQHIFKQFPVNKRYSSALNRAFSKRPESLQKLENARSKALQNLRDTSRQVRWIEEFVDLKKFLNTIENEDFEKIHKYTVTDQFYELSSVWEYKGPIFQRVIFDEANSIHLPNCREVMGKYHWFVTSSLSELLFPRGHPIWHQGKSIPTGPGIRCKGFIRDTFQNNNFDRIPNWLHITGMYLKNCDDFVKASFALEEPLFREIQCFTPQEYMALKNISVPEVLQALHAGDITTAIEFIGCTVASETSITELVLHKLQKQLQQMEEKIAGKQDHLAILKDAVREAQEMSAAEEPPREEHATQLKSCKKKLSTCQMTIKRYTEKKNTLCAKIAALTERISNIDTKTCPICTDTVKNACLTPCCRNAFCFECLTQSVKFSPRCPLCRTKIKLQDVTVVSARAEEELSQKRAQRKALPTKMECLLDMIAAKPSGRFLVFSEYDNTFNMIMDKLTSAKIPFSKLNGSTGRVTNIIRDFATNKIKVLLLNAKYYGSGLNLQCCTDIILYHRMSEDLEKQIVGRGQRPGRTSRLNVFHLCYETEL